jgi:hypothetical protein
MLVHFEKIVKFTDLIHHILLFGQLNFNLYWRFLF